MSQLPVSFFVTAAAIVAVVLITSLLEWDIVSTVVALVLVIVMFVLHEKEENR